MLTLITTPGGMAAAEALRNKGYQVTIYDRYDRAGGLLTYGIPGFKLEKDVVVRRIPVAFREDFAPQQRLYFSLEAMGLLDKLHVKVFQAIHGERLPLNTDASILTWIEKQGVDKTKFADTAKSFGVASKLKRAVQLQNDFKIEGVPSLGVAGKYYIDGTSAGNMDRALQVTDSLLALVRQGRA